jgi:phospholipase A1
VAGPCIAVAQSQAWQACAAMPDAANRLACFDRWAQSQQPPAQASSSTAPAPTAPVLPAAPAPAPSAATAPAATPSSREAAAGADAATQQALTIARMGLRLTTKDGCRQAEYTLLSRVWELEGNSDCGTFGLRGFRPTSVAISSGDSVNRQPTSGNPLNNPPTAQPYRTTEMRLQLSVRTKIAKGLLQHERPEATDSLWFAYTQQSYWQLFTPALSRPFRNTDHEPEVIYVYPLQSADATRWRLRYGGVGLVHQSNGQSLPLSRSWNRVYLMAGAEKGDFVVAGRVWRRLKESAENDDNPGIGSYIGRAELTLGRNFGRDNRVQATLRHSLDRAARGSVRLEWFRTLASDQAGIAGGLQLHTQLFSGYGDTLLDYNRRRTMFSIGLSLSDW